MDCRIEVTDEGKVRTIGIVGRMLGEHVPSLLAACAEAVQVRVDLAEMLSIDAIAADALRHMRDTGTPLVRVPPFIQFKLDSASPRLPGT